MENGYIKVASYEAKIGEVKRVLLLYSGGLDSSCMIPWLKEKYGCEVVTLTVNLGQMADDLEAVRQRALKLGAEEALVVDATERFYKECLTKAILANGCYNGYYLSTPLGRIVTCEVAVEAAKEVGADAIGHGCTGKGNDQVRFDAGILALWPEAKIVAPAREWSMGRKEELEFARKHGVDVSVVKRSPYSHDDNLWGVTSEGREIEDAEQVPRLEEALSVCNTSQGAPNEPSQIEIEFERGLPVALNGERLDGVELVRRLNRLGAMHGVGVSVVHEDRIVGLKVRGVYEAPAAHILITAHKALETLVLTKQQLLQKQALEPLWARLVYEGLWHEPARADLDALFAHSNRTATGTVVLQLYKGNCVALAVKSRYSLLDARLATFEAERLFNKSASAPFIELYSLQMRKVAQLHRLLEEEQCHGCGTPATAL